MIMFKKLINVKKRQGIKRTISACVAAYALRYGRINKNHDLFIHSSQQIQSTNSQYTVADEQSLIESQSVNSTLVKIDSGAVIEIKVSKTSEALKSALETRGGEDRFWKFGPGSKARGAARGNGRKARNSSIFANAFVPQQTYCQYHKSDPPLSCKQMNKLSDSPFQGNGDNGNNHQPPSEDGKFDASQYKSGPSPFKKHEYEDPAVVAQNIGFNQPKRLNKSYDKHAKDCFNIMENRNKENLENFKGDIQNLAQSADEVYKGSYRYQDPAYIFLKEIDGKMTAVIVNATDGEYITSINPTNNQIEDLESNGNIGLDTRPSMQLTLRLRGPKSSNL